MNKYVNICGREYISPGVKTIKISTKSLLCVSGDGLSGYAGHNWDDPASPQGLGDYPGHSLDDWSN